MIVKLFGGLLVAVGVIAAAFAGNSTPAKSTDSGGNKPACCSKDCCKDCPNCSCECGCCDDCTNGCACPNMNK